MDENKNVLYYKLINFFTFFINKETTLFNKGFYLFQ